MAARLDGYGGMGRAGRRLARGTVRRFDLDQHRAAKGLPPTGVRGLLQDRSPPTSATPRERALVGPGCTRSSPDNTSCQEQSENIPTHPPVITGLVPVMTIRKALRLTAS